VQPWHGAEGLCFRIWAPAGQYLPLTGQEEVRYLKFTVSKQWWFPMCYFGRKVGKLNVLLLSLSQEVPVNVQFCLEGMEESGSEGLDELIFAQKDKFFKDVDYICISDNYWLGKKKPCITYGLRGICYFFIEVWCCILQPPFISR
jgi:hypothetical protein